MSEMVVKQKNPHWILQLLWFFFIGIWLGEIWILISWFFMATIIGLPLGIAMINQLPKIIALRQTGGGLVVKSADGITQVEGVKQRNFIIRAIYFVLIGWWFSGIWMQVAYFFCVIIIGLPVGFWMFDRVPAVVSLKR